MRDLDLDARPRGTMRCGGGRSCDRGRASCSRLFHLDISSSSGDAGDARATARAAAAAPPTHPLARAPLPPLVGRRPGGGRVASPRRRRRSAGGGAGGRGSTLLAVNILLCPGSFSPPTPLHARLPLSPGVVSLCQSVHAYAHTNLPCRGCTFLCTFLYVKWGRSRAVWTCRRSGPHAPFSITYAHSRSSWAAEPVLELRAS